MFSQDVCGMFSLKIESKEPIWLIFQIEGEEFWDPQPTYVLVPGTRKTEEMSEGSEELESWS